MRPHYLGVGSILKNATASSTVIGSGFLSKSDSVEERPGRIISLRGRLSLELVNHISDVWLGDPMVFIDRIYPAAKEKKYQLGYVPHVSMYLQAKGQFSDKIKVINPSDEPWQVVAEIAACERIMSQSLHGLIVADALNVPNIWIEPSEKMSGGRFKFDDYYTTLDHSKRAFAVNTDLIENPPTDAFSVGIYIYDKTEYIDLITKCLKPGEVS